MKFLRSCPLAFLLYIILINFSIADKTLAADVRLAWDANTESDLASYKIYYGTSPGQYSASASAGMQTTYTVSGLQPGTWYFVITALNVSGTESLYSNEVSKSLNSTAPVIGSVQAINVSNSGATVTWTTNAAADSQVEYGPTSAYGSLTPVNTTLVTEHSIALPGLASNTLYHYRVRSKDGSGSLAVSPDFVFATGGSLDITPPVISEVMSTPDGTGVLVSWKTHEGSDSQVEYGPTTAYELSTAVESTMVTSHAVRIAGLNAGTVYHFRVRSRDSAGNAAVSGDFTFTAPSTQSSAPAFVQSNASQVASGAAVSVAFPASNKAGNLIVAYVVWDNSGPVSLTDSSGNTYTSAIGPTQYSGDRANAQIFYARNIAGGVNTVKASFSTPITSWGILYIHEYSGIDTNAPLAGATAGTGSSSTMNSGALTTATPNALLFAGGVSNGSVTLGTNLYTIRSNQYGNLTEDRVAAQPGTYSAAATQDASAWIMQLAAFKAAAVIPDTTKPQITSVASSGITSSGATITWTTNKPSDSQVEYGLSSAYGSSSQTDSSPITAHSVVLSGLAAGTTYHFRAKSIDAAGNLAISSDMTFSTIPVNTSVLTPKFVQQKEASISSGNTVSVGFPFSNTAGNLIVAYVVWDNNGPVTVADSKGNRYVSAVGPTQYIGDRTNAQIFYAGNIAGGSNTVKVTFSNPVNSWGILYIHEYSGVDRSSPLEASTAGTGSSSIMNSGTVTTRSANALLFAAGESNGAITLGSNRYVVRSNQYGNLTEDMIAAQPGTYDAAATQNADVWVMQLAAFRAETRRSKTRMALPLLSTSSSEVGASTMRYSALAVVNSDTEPATLTFTALDSEGSELGGSGITNPTVRTLAPGEQLRVVDRQLFGDGIEGAEPGGVIKVESSTARIGGQYAFFNGDASMYQGAEIPTEPLQTVIMPEIGEREGTRFTAVNSGQEPAVISFDVVAADGTVRMSMDRTISPDGGIFSESLSALFGTAPDKSEYVRVRTTAGVNALTLSENQNGDMLVANGLDQGAGAPVLYAAQYEMAPGSDSTLSIVNLDSRQGTVTIRLINEDTGQVQGTRTIPIAANGKIYIDNPSSLNPESAGQGYLEIRSDGVRMTGSVAFKDPAKQLSTATLPLASGLQNTVLLSNMAQNDLFSSSITLLNPGDDDAMPNIELYTSEGTLLASTAESISPHQRKSRPVRDYFPELAGAQWTSGYVVIRTDTRIVAFSTVQNSHSVILTAIPPQTIQ